MNPLPTDKKYSLTRHLQCLLGPHGRTEFFEEEVEAGIRKQFGHALAFIRSGRSYREFRDCLKRNRDFDRVLFPAQRWSDAF